MLHDMLNDNDYQYFQKIDEDSNLQVKMLNCPNESKDVINRLHILNIQEKERQRIARDLHDTSLQNLTHLIHKIELSSMYIDKDSIKAKLELATVNKNLKSIIDEIRNVIFNLRPMNFSETNLIESIDCLIDKLSDNPNIKIITFVEELNCDDPLILMAIFRIIKECMINALKHSSGNKIVLSLKNESDNYCSIVIEDNGKSFDYSKINCFDGKKHFGLCILKERVEYLSGKLNINSNPGIGTTIEIFIPL